MPEPAHPSFCLRLRILRLLLGLVVGLFATSRVVGASLLDLSFRLDPKVVGRVDTVAVQSDGRIVLAGIQTNASGNLEWFLRRLLANGQIDSAFRAPAGGLLDPLAFYYRGGITSLKIRANDSMAIGIAAYFDGFYPKGPYSTTQVYAFSANGIAQGQKGFSGDLRFAYDSKDTLILGGEVLATFSAGNESYPVLFDVSGDLKAPSWISRSGGGYISYLNAFVIAKNGDLLIAGSMRDKWDYPGEIIAARFTRTGEELWRISQDIAFGFHSPTIISEAEDGMLMLGNYGNPIRLYPNGQLDTNYFVEPKNGRMACWGLRSGEVLVTGPFTRDGQTPVPGIALLSTNGSPVPKFQVQTGIDSGSVTGVVEQDDGLLLVFGTFQGFDGVRRPSLIRLFRENPSDVQVLPTLSIQLDENRNLNVSWPTTNRAVALEFTSSLVPLVDWQPVAGTLTATNGLASLRIANPVTLSPRYYRLRGDP